MNGDGIMPIAIIGGFYAGPIERQAGVSSPWNPGRTGRGTCDQARLGSAARAAGFGRTRGISVVPSVRLRIMVLMVSN